jgi:heavy metal translocating P-type ATPase
MLISEEKDSNAPPLLPGRLDQYIAAVCFVAIASHLIVRYAMHTSAHTANWPLIIALAVGGTPLVFTLLLRLAQGKFGSDLLAGISIVTAVILGQYLAGSFIVLMLSGGTALEEMATRRAASVLEALAGRMPRVAHRKGQSGLEDIDLAEVRVGQVLVVLPHENCPVDGAVIEGNGAMDESYLTGEPYLNSKTTGSYVLSGAINGQTALTIRVDQLPKDSRYARIVRVMQEAEMRRPRFRRIGDRLGAWYTLLALSVATLGWLGGHDATRFLAVLVIATPCPLLLAIPVAIIGSISVAASRAIVVKDPAMLERIDSCQVMIFDKTGTLTYGKPALTEVVCAPGLSRETILSLAASLEQYSKHPLASAIRDAAHDQKIALRPVSEISEPPGSGLKGVVEGQLILLTGRRRALEMFPQWAKVLPPAMAGMESILLIDEQYSATLRFRDAPREESRTFISHLRPKHGIRRIILLSGDRESEVRYLAEQVGITEALFSKSPEEKVEIVRRETQKAPTMFLGDGINDAPAMQAATVGVAFGQNSDITAEAADAVVLETSLSRVDELIHIGRRMKRIALQSAIGGMALSLAGMAIAALGYLPPVAGAVTQELIDLAAVLNAVRAALPAPDLRSDAL